MVWNDIAPFPAMPIQNGFIESFNGELRGGCFIGLAPCTYRHFGCGTGHVVMGPAIIMRLLFWEGRGDRK